MFSITLVEPELGLVEFVELFVGLELLEGLALFKVLELFEFVALDASGVLAGLELLFAGNLPPARK